MAAMAIPIIACDVAVFFATRPRRYHVVVAVREQTIHFVTRLCVRTPCVSQIRGWQMCWEGHLAKLYWHAASLVMALDSLRATLRYLILNLLLIYCAGSIKLRVRLHFSSSFFYLSYHRRWMLRFWFSIGGVLFSLSQTDCYPGSYCVVGIICVAGRF